MHHLNICEQLTSNLSNIQLKVPNVLSKYTSLLASSNGVFAIIVWEFLRESGLYTPGWLKVSCKRLTFIFLNFSIFFKLDWIWRSCLKLWWCFSCHAADFAFITRQSTSHQLLSEMESSFQLIIDILGTIDGSIYPIDDKIPGSTNKMI